ncbi:MAG: flagellar biosynthesis protein FlgL [Alphaproteobacteria bacterium]|nr:flagellar biosynthesis protein FlgL [Alphaproteobacteria bacterium]
MSFQSIGDLSQHFQSLRQGSAIKTRMNTLTQELSSGRIADLSSHLQGNIGQLAVLDREIAVIDGFDLTAGQLQQQLAQKQIVLSRMTTEQIDLATQQLGISSSSSETEIRAAEAAGRAGFDAFADLLNARLGDRSLFAGAAVDRPAVASGADMLADILTSIGGATDAASITASIDAWFDDPAGGFATLGYTGDTGPAPTQRTGSQDVLTLTGRADDQGFRDMLKAAALTAVSDALSGTLDKPTRAALMRTGAERGFGAAKAVTAIAARIGEDEQRLDEGATRRTAQRTTFATARNALVTADPFDTATLLQSVQQQLELHYTATARLSRLSLANYL